MKIVAFDVETAGTEQEYALQPYRVRSDDAWLTMFAIATEAGSTGELIEPGVAGRVKMLTNLGRFLDRCAATNTYITGWNTAFDAAWLIAYGLRDKVMKCKWLDAMLLYRHLTAAPEWVPTAVNGYGLKAAVAKFYPEHAGYDDGIDFNAIGSGDLGAILKLTAYNRKDAEFTRSLTLKFLAEMPPEVKRAALIEAACIPMIAETYVEGLAGDGAAAQGLAETLADTANLNFVKLKLADSGVEPSVLASPKQLSELLFQKWGLPVVKMTTKGAFSTDKDALALLAGKDERAKLLHNYREAKNNGTKFADGMLKSLEYNGDGHTRPQARIYGTYTGRMTYSSKQGKGKAERPTGVALHQWKRDPAFRKLVRAPEGYTLLEFDFAGQEFRWMAHLSEDPAMLSLCAEGEDAHSYMGGRIVNRGYRELMAAVADSDKQAKNDRQLGKVANLSCQYRTSAARLVTVALSQYGITLPQPLANAIHATYRTTYPRVPLYWKAQIYKGKRDGYVETVAGRRVYLGTGDTWDHQMNWSYESTTINFPVQGTGADQKYLALLVLRDYLPSVDGRFYFELHDGVFCIVPDRYAEKATVDIHRLLSNLPYKKAWGVDLPIHFPVDAKAGKSWGELVEVKL